MISPAYDTPQPPAQCERREPRTNLFVLATLVASGTANRIKVRNISASGALVEGAVLPRPGAAITLSRGDAALTGRVMWCAGGKAGLQFDGRAVVAQWLPSTNGAQREVDRSTALAQAERAAGILPASAPAPLPSTALTAIDLVAMANALDHLADEMAGDRDVIAKYLGQLQILDVAAQALRKCGQAMRQAS